MPRAQVTRELISSVRSAVKYIYIYIYIYICIYIMCVCVYVRVYPNSAAFHEVNDATTALSKIY